MKFGKKELQAVLVLLGLIVVGCTYYFGYMKINEETEAIERENVTLKAQADAYEILYTKASTYNAERSRMEQELPGLEDNFVYGISTEDEIMYVTNLEDNQADDNLMINYLNMSQGSSLPYTPTIETDSAFSSGAISMPTVADDGIVLVKYSIDYGCSVSYEGFKNMVNYLNNVGGDKTISSVSLTFDSSTGLLNGVIGVDLYALTGTGNNYNALPIPKVDLGVENIFGTVEIVDESLAEDAEGEETEEAE